MPVIGLNPCLHRRPNVPIWTPDPPLLNYSLSQVAEKITIFRNTLEAEHKQVTVLTAHLKIMVALLVAQDPKQARQLLHLVLECMMAVAYRDEGTVSQVLEDGIIALFGVLIDYCLPLVMSAPMLVRLAEEPTPHGRRRSTLQETGHRNTRRSRRSSP
jgi:class 3 adenylate cyclase